MQQCVHLRRPNLLLALQDDPLVCKARQLDLGLERILLRRQPGRVASGGDVVSVLLNLFISGIFHSR